MTDGFSLHGDCWEGVHNREWHIDPASIEDVLRALARLDARKYTMLTIRRSGEQHFVIGGGAGRYVVYATFDNEEFWNLSTGGAEAGVVMINAGGQEGDFPARHVVDPQRAAAAAKAFCLRGALEPAESWEKQ
jgi:Immunity protein Imm1